MSVQTIPDTVASWEQLLEIARSKTSARRVRRLGQSPSTTPIPSSLDKLAPGERNDKRLP